MQSPNFTLNINLNRNLEKMRCRKDCYPQQSIPLFEKKKERP